MFAGLMYLVLIPFGIAYVITKYIVMGQHMNTVK